MGGCAEGDGERTDLRWAHPDAQVAFGKAVGHPAFEGGAVVEEGGLSGFADEGWGSAVRHEHLHDALCHFFISEITVQFNFHRFIVLLFVD